ncbi:MAG: glycosyltransferase family 2 protein [Pseudomonadota bacterium]|nr:glycosyltransferase family 2 protein [Pseudomonadota bacterium]
MTTSDGPNAWKPGSAPVAVVMISLNEAHNMEAVLQNLQGWAQQVFLVDSFSADDTVDIALRHGVHVVQRPFRGFGDQWNFALRELPITAPWTMKLDPDERLGPGLKREIEQRLLLQDPIDGYRVPIRLYFMGQRLGHALCLSRLWRTGAACFSDVLANEHARVEGEEGVLHEEIEHRDSPDLDHWMIKQNRYSTAEAAARFQQHPLADTPQLLGTPLQRRMWLKRHFWRLPGRYLVLFAYHLLALGAWRAGRVGWIWARLRTEVFRLQEYKYFEIQRLGRLPSRVPSHVGLPDPRVQQHD